MPERPTESPESRAPDTAGPASPPTTQPSSVAPPQARSIDLSNRRLGDTEFEDFVSKNRDLFGRMDVEEVRLDGNDLTVQSIEVLARVLRGTPTEFLASENRLGDKGARLIAATPQLRALHTLHLADNALTATGVEALLGESSGLTRLRTLGLDRNPLGERGATALASCQQSRTLRSLSLVQVQLADEGVKTLAHSDSLALLSHLDLSWNSITAVGIDELVGPGTALTGVTVLSLSGNPIGDEGAMALASTDNATHLATLYITSIGLTDAGAAALARSPHFTALRRLDLTGNELSEGGKAALRDSAQLEGCTMVTERSTVPPAPAGITLSVIVRDPDGGAIENALVYLFLAEVDVLGVDDLLAAENRHRSAVQSAIAVGKQGATFTRVPVGTVTLCALPVGGDLIQPGAFERLGPATRRLSVTCIHHTIASSPATQTVTLAADPFNS